MKNIAGVTAGVIATVIAAAIAASAPAAEPPRRIVSLIPAVTEMLFAIGDGSRLVGVGNYDRFPPEVEKIPRVGGLLDPDVERILSLRPDLVIVYNTQQELKQRLDRARIPYYPYEHRGLQDIMETIRTLGARIGSANRANALAARLEADLSAIRRSVAGLARPKVLLVFGRDPGSLRNIDASGGYGFLHDMLDVAGGDNLFADIHQQSVQATTEMILARRPDVIIEFRYAGSVRAADVPAEIRTWDALASLPAVRNRRVYVLSGDEYVVPGPRVAAATRRLSETLHPRTNR
jgi:iron complex transport system substrate-binding protein